MKHISYLFISTLLLFSPAFADDAQDAIETIQCAHCPCTVSAEKVTKGSAATCACCSSRDEAQRSMACQCDQAGLSEKCDAQQCSMTKSCCSQKRLTSESFEEEQTTQCAHCPCAVAVSEHQTKSPATCACCQSDNGRAALCMCEENAAVNDCMGCLKKKVNEENNQ